MLSWCLCSLMNLQRCELALCGCILVEVIKCFQALLDKSRHAHFTITLVKFGGLKDPEAIEWMHGKMQFRGTTQEGGTRSSNIQNHYFCSFGLIYSKIIIENHHWCSFNWGTCRILQNHHFLFGRTMGVSLVEEKYYEWSYTSDKGKHIDSSKI